MILSEFYDWFDNATESVSFLTEIDFKVWSKLIGQVCQEDRRDAAIYYQVTRGYVEIMQGWYELIKSGLEKGLRLESLDPPVWVPIEAV